MAQAKFTLGLLVATPGVVAAVSREDIWQALTRHAQGDWGTVCDEDKQANDEALNDGARILSAYTSQSGTKFWVITEADRSATTVLLPEEY